MLGRNSPLGRLSRRARPRVTTWYLDRRDASLAARQRFAQYARSRASAAWDAAGRPVCRLLASTLAAPLTRATERAWRRLQHAMDPLLGAVRRCGADVAHALRQRSDNACGRLLTGARHSLRNRLDEFAFWSQRITERTGFQPMRTLGALAAAGLGIMLVRHSLRPSEIALSAQEIAMLASFANAPGDTWTRPPEAALWQLKHDELRGSNANRQPADAPSSSSDPRSPFSPPPSDVASTPVLDSRGP
ncbi:MAG: hypothetical protein SFZ23_04180 [Planctomycetota bacterium]|nr:hypothetical protein [Planctomycetota bacterium]